VEWVDGAVALNVLAEVSREQNGSARRSAEGKGTQWFYFPPNRSSSAVQTDTKQLAEKRYGTASCPIVSRCDQASADTDDVVAAIRYAGTNGHKVGIRSGGHSWAASHLRDGGLLLDVSRLDRCTVDTDRMTGRSGRARSPASSWPNSTRKGFSSPRAIAKAIALVAFCCRADTAGTVRRLDWHVRACLGWRSSPPTVS
jgi:hypothetical protein